MNNQSILRNEQPTAPTYEDSEVKSNSAEPSENYDRAEHVNCKNGICLVAWKPQRPAAA